MGRGRALLPPAPRSRRSSALVLPTWRSHAPTRHAPTTSSNARLPPQDSAEAGTKQEVAALLLQLLRQKAGMLEEHWGLAIDAGAR